MLAPGSFLGPARRFLVLTAALVAVYFAAAPFFYQSDLVRVLAGWVALAGGTVLSAAGTEATVCFAPWGRWAMRSARGAWKCTTVSAALKRGPWRPPPPIDWTAARRSGRAVASRRLRASTSQHAPARAAQQGRGSTGTRQRPTILRRVENYTGSPALVAYAWFRSEALPGFGGKTADELVREGHASYVHSYLDRLIAAGYVGMRVRSFAPGAGSTATASDYSIMPASVTFPERTRGAYTASMMVEVEAMTDDDIDDMEMLVLDAELAGAVTANGADADTHAGVSTLTIEEGTMKYVWAKTQQEVEDAIYAAKEAGAGDDMTFTAGEMIEVMGSALFNAAEGVTLSYTAESDMSDVASASVSGGAVTVTAAGEGMAHITITAHASMPSGVKVVDQTDPREASVKFPVEVGLEALSIMLAGPEDMNVAEGMSAEVTATANRAVSADTMVMLMRDRSMSSPGASDDDFMADAITIKAGEMMGSTMVMAVEDNMAEDMEELVLYGMTEGMAGEVTGEVKLYIWDAAVPALPIIAQLLLAAFLAVGGYRRYLRR